jgi:glycosyltransferase involved in cell wall biosynthesis
MQAGISVLVCSFNGSRRLPETLAHLAKQECPEGLQWEVIIIDNASTDQTAEVAKTEWQKREVVNAGFRVLHEKSAGKIHALHKGIEHAKFDRFIICDDDNWLLPNYVATAFYLLQLHPEVGAAGGRGIGVAESGELPDWFPAYGKDYAIGPQDDEGISGDITRRRGYLWGAGMVSRTALFKKMYEDFPFLLTGRKNAALIGGEDAEYCLRLVLSNYRLWYDENLVFKHFMPAQRLELSYRDQLVETLETDRIILDKYYLAVKMKFKCEGRPLNRLRLMLMTPLRFLLAGRKSKAVTEKWKLRFLYPFEERKDPVMFAIKLFMRRNSQAKPDYFLKSNTLI